MLAEITKYFHFHVDSQKVIINFKWWKLQMKVSFMSPKCWSFQIRVSFSLKCPEMQAVF